MAEYIDREAFKKEIRRLSTHYLNEWDTLGVLAAVDRIPAADVRPVVLCRDCIHARRYTNKIKCGYWSEQTASEIVCEDDFCSYGEKREES